MKALLIFSEGDFAWGYEVGDARLEISRECDTMGLVNETTLSVTGREYVLRGDDLRRLFK